MTHHPTPIDIVRGLVSVNPYGEDFGCVFCRGEYPESGEEEPVEHDEMCPWLAGRRLVGLPDTAS
jgi:hypothetical protein